MLKKLFRAIFSNAWLKLLSLALALVIWFGARSRLREETHLSVPLKVIVPSGFQIVHESWDKIDLRVSGPRSLIARLSRDEDYLRMTVLLSQEELEESSVEVEVSPDWLNIARGELVQLHVRDISPRVVRILASEQMEKELTVKPLWSGKPPAGYEVARVTAQPSSVLVRGPDLVLDKLSEIETEETFVWDLKGSMTRPRALLREKSLELESGESVRVMLRPSQPRVHVTVEIRSQEGEKSLRDVPVHVLLPPGFPYDVDVPREEASVSVVVAGPQEDLRKVDRESLLVFVRADGLAREKIEPGGNARYKESVHALPPRDLAVSVRSISPDSVTVILHNPVK